VCAALMPLMVAVAGCFGYCSMQKHKRCSYTAEDFATLAAATRCK